PGALAVTGFDVRSIEDPGLPDEFEAARRIHAAMRAPNGSTRTFITYNGLRFDDELLRTLFWRNLLDPYVTSGRQARRIDILPLVQLASHMVPGAVRIADEGTPGRWRLENVAPLNGIATASHDGVGDAVATLD